MPIWPASLPQELLPDGITVRDDDAVLRTPMDAGPPTRRNRFTAVTRRLTGGIVLTGTEKQAFDIFYRDDLANGAVAFDWTDPVTGSTISVAFREPPEFALVAPGPAGERVWQAQLQMEVQP